jgi:outer membrane immunogenic protein
MPFRRRSKDAGGVLRSLTSDPALRLPFLLVFDVAADDVGDVGVLFFLFLDKGVVVVERLVHLDFLFLLDPGLRGRGLLGSALRLGIGLFERDGLDLLRLGCGSLLRNWRAWCDWGGRSYRPGRHHDLIHRPAFWAVNRIFVQIIEFSATTGTEPFGTQLGFRHGPILRAIWVLHLASRKAGVNSRRAHVGAGWTTKEWTFESPLLITLGSDTISGFLGGAQIGANYQIDVMVFGVEGDFSWASLSGQTCNAITGAVECNSDADRFATVTGRFGIVGFDRALFYLKAGGAWVHDTNEITTVGPQTHSSVSANRTGWTAGGGIEYALPRNWSAKLEYDFMDFGTRSYPFDLTPTVFGVANVDIKQRVQVVKFGLNYRFGWGL